MLGQNKLPLFTYQSVLEKIKSIDVVWLSSKYTINNNLFPTHVFEIETSTNFIKSLIKFNELRYFNINMVIMAPSSRKSEFESAIDWGVYEEIRKE